MTITKLFCTIGIIAAAIYDLIIIQIGGVDWSISRWFQTVGFAAPFELLVLGYLLGHFFGTMPFKYRLYRIQDTNYNDNNKYVISGHQPKNEVIAKATKFQDFIVTEITDPIIL